MKKIVMMLMGVAATINVMAVTYTAKANLLLEATSGENCELYLRQADSYGALGGYEMYMDGRQVALYALNGTTPLQMATAANLENVKLGLKSDASTSYTITVSGVEGSETLYLWDGTSASCALTEGAVINLTATASATDEARFVIKKSELPTTPQLCFEKNVLKVIAHEGESLVVKNGATELVNIPSLPYIYTSDDFGALVPAETRLVVTLNGVDYQIDVNPHVTPLVLVP